MRDHDHDPVLPRAHDPEEPAQNTLDRRKGWRGQREQETARRRQERATDDQRRRRIILPSRALAFYREAIGGTGVQSMRRGPPLPSGNITTIVRYPMGAAGRVIAGSLWSLGARTAGTATLQVRISKGGGTETVVNLGICTIDGLTVDGHLRDQAAEWACPVDNGIPFAKGDALRASIDLSGWTPDPTDFGAEIMIVYDGLS